MESLDTPKWMRVLVALHELEKRRPGEMYLEKMIRYVPVSRSCLSRCVRLFVEDHLLESRLTDHRRLYSFTEQGRVAVQGARHFCPDTTKEVTAQWENIPSHQ